MKKQQTRKYKNPFIRRILVGLTGFVLFLSLSGLPSLARDVPAKFPFSNPQQQQRIITFAFNPIWSKIGAFERVPWYETVWVQLGIAGFCAIVFLSACIVWLIRPLIRRLRGKPFQKK